LKFFLLRGWKLPWNLILRENIYLKIQVPSIKSFKFFVPFYAISWVLNLPFVNLNLCVCTKCLVVYLYLNFTIRSWKIFKATQSILVNDAPSIENKFTWGRNLYNNFYWNTFWLICVCFSFALLHSIFSNKINKSRWLNICI
jgi:hypothetical protein